MTTAPVRRTYRGLIAVGLALHVVAVLALTAWLHGPLVVPRDDWEPPVAVTELDRTPGPMPVPGPDPDSIPTPTPTLTRNRWVEVNALPRDDSPEPPLDPEDR